MLLLSYKVNAQFIEHSKEVGIDHLTIDPTNLGGGVAFLDFQNDGFDDIYLIGGDNPDRLYENQGNGTFKDASEKMGIDVIDDVSTMGVTCGDIDNDGYVDILITSKNKERSYLFWNENGSLFVERANEAGISETYYGSSAALSDYDVDGHLDLYICNYDAGPPGDFLLKNNGDRTFSDESYLLGEDREGTALAIAFSDVDMDHDVDILVGNDFGYLYQPNRLFINNYPNSSFNEISQRAAWDIEINSMGIAVGDYDEDGDFDYYVSDIDDNFLFNNQLDNTFSEMAHEKKVDNSDGTSWGNAFFDYDNDSYLDLFVANGVFEIGQTDQENKLFRGNGESFEDVSTLQGVDSKYRGRGLAIGDYNNDGQPDILVGVVSNSSLDSHHTLLYENQGTDHSWIKIKLDGISSNKDGYGSKVRVVFGGRSLIRELSGGTSYLSHMSNTLHFGLGNISGIDSLIVTWPNGTEQIFKNIEPNQTYLVVENQELLRSTSVYATIFSDEEIYLQGDFRNKEGVYLDTLMGDDGLREIIKTRLAIIKRDQTVTLIENNHSNEDHFKVWPNPVQDDMYMSLDGQSGGFNHGVIEIFELTGQLVFEKIIEGGEGSIIELSHLNLRSGIYIVRLSNDGKIYKRKIVKR